MISTRKWKHLDKRQIIQLNKILSGFVIGIQTNAGGDGDETLGLQTDSLSNTLGRFIVGENCACQNQVIENNFEDKITKSIDSAVMAVESRR